MARRRRRRRGGRRDGGATVLHPGVYVEETSSGARPIEGVGTSTAAFVGGVPDTPAPLWRRVLPFVLVAATAAAVAMRLRRRDR